MRTEEQRAARREYRKLPHVLEADRIALRNRRAANRERQRQYAKERYQKNLEKERARSRAKNKSNPEIARRAKARYKENHPERLKAAHSGRARAFRAALNAIKISAGCCDCGYKGHPAALDFDHVTGKKRCSPSLCGSIAAAIEEAKKCEVRCANCHRIATFNRGQYKRKPLACAV